VAPANYIPLSVPDLGDSEQRYVLECLRTNWISSVGRFVDEFEHRFAEYVGAHRAVAVTNGTAALHLSLLSSGVSAGDLVIVPSATFVSPVNVIRYVGADPVFLDIRLETLGLDPAVLESFLEQECERRETGMYMRSNGRRVRALLPVHLYGHACDIQFLQSIASRYQLILIEDAAEAVGTRVGERHVGTYGLTGCFSFNGNKTLTTGGGGMVVTDDAKLADLIRHLSTQAKADAYRYLHDMVGYNYRLSNIQAAIGLAQLERIDEMLRRKKEIHSVYREAFASLSAVNLFVAQEWCSCNYWMALLFIPPAEHDSFAAHMRECKIQVRPIWELPHRLPMYEGCFHGDMSRSEHLQTCAICLPCHQGMSDREVERVVHGVERFFG